jgi:hypothetical protein
MSTYASSSLKLSDVDICVQLVNEHREFLNAPFHHFGDHAAVIPLTVLLPSLENKSWLTN